MQLPIFTILSSLLFFSAMGRKLPARPIQYDSASCATLSSQCPVPDPAMPVYFPDPASCHSFCECSNGVAIYKACDPTTMVYNPTTGVCETEDEYPCSTGTELIKMLLKSVKPSKFAADPGQQCSTSVSAQCPNPDPANPVYLPNPDVPDCTTFCECSDGIAYLQDCPPGTLFDSANSQCDSNTTYTCTTSGSGTTAGAGGRTAAGDATTTGAPIVLY